MSWNNGDVIQVPESYVTASDSHIRISNHPESAKDVTPIQIVALNRPDKLNAITLDMLKELIAFFTAVNVDDRVKVVILTGIGRVFSAGIDLKEDSSMVKNMPVNVVRDPGGTLALAMYNCSKVVMVAYNGLSIGIGMTSTLAAGIRLAPAKAEFGFPFARIGLTMESCSSFFLPRMVGYSNATYLLATGKRFPAESKVLDGLFAELLPRPEDVLPRALALADDILQNVSPMAIHLNRQLIWRNGGTAEAAHLTDSPILADMFGGEDHAEYKTAFFKKQLPNYANTLNKNAPRSYPWWEEVSVKSPPRAVPRNSSKL
ncbi:enoyl-CoA hydratase/isomerase [Paraphoma chrysanthemicola]|nr:enoyl-CoA hydratase/isomerase [Paraphoma chrysanthemicola]